MNLLLLRSVCCSITVDARALRCLKNSKGSRVLEVLWQLRSGELGLLSNLICLGMGVMIGRSTANFSDGSAGMRVCDGGKSGKCGSSFVGTCTQRKG
jgi:hypothetical protein